MSISIQTSLAILFFCILAIIDYKKKMIPNILIAVFYLYMLLIHSDTFLIMTIFAIIFLINTIVAQLTKKEALGWGDVLIIPLYTSILTNFISLELILVSIASATMLASFIDEKTKKIQPLLPYLLIPLILSILFWMASQF